PSLGSAFPAYCHPHVPALGDGWPRPRASASQRHGPVRSGSRGTGPVRLVMDYLGLGHVREPVLFLDPANPAERGHVVITTRPYRFVRHPGYTAALVAAVTSGIALGSWISTFIAPVALVLLVWRTTVEDRMLQRDLPGYAEYAARVRYRLVPGIW